MFLHPSHLQLSKRLCCFLPIPGIVALATYLLSLSHGVCPGYAATLTAAAAGLVPPSYAAHPLFAWAARNIAMLDVFSLPVRLNLFSALCGTLCAMLLYHLVGRMILLSACEDAGGGEREDGAETDDAPAMPPEVEHYNRYVLRIAIAGGLIAALLFTFTVPAWSAATRLDKGLFDLLLALASLSLFPTDTTVSLRAPRLALSFFLIVLGCFESAVFLLLLPCYLVFTFREFLLSEQRVALGCGIAVVGAAGVALSVAAFGLNADIEPGATLLTILKVYARALPVYHYHELRSFFPRSGWALVLMQIGLPAMILLFGQQILFREKRINTLMASFMVLLAATPGLLNLSISPFVFFQPTNHLPVFGYAILAAALASAVAACLLVVAPDDSPQYEDSSSMQALIDQQRLRILRGVAGGLLPALFLLAAATPWRSFQDVDTRRVSFADEIAREMLTVMKARTWLISNGYIDNHLLIQAFMLNKPLVLIPLRPQDLPQEREQIKKTIASSPVFAGQNRQRLLNALSIGTVRFVMEWFNTDKNAGNHAMVFATPDLWTSCGYRAVPEGLAFGGVLPDHTPDVTRIAEENRTFAERMMPLLEKQSGQAWHISALRERLRMKAGFAANELGVLLEEMNQVEAAYQAYLSAIQIDPMNLSAAVNGYGLASTQKIHPEALDRLNKKMNALTASRNYQALGLTGTLQNYGAIRQPEYYLRQAAMWASRGARAVSTDKIRKALALSEQTGAAALVENALFYAHAGDSAKAESCYLAALEKEASNKDALSGICTLMLSKRNTQETETWIQKALSAGVGKDELLYQTATLAILKGDKEQALVILKEATKKYPNDLRYWTLQADVLISQGDEGLVEHTVLPEMQKALKNPNHFLVHAVRGFVLRKKGPSHFQEARLSLLRALSLNAALPEIWKAVFDLDMALNNPAFTETDARNLLKIDPDHALANYLMGSQLLSRGALQEAEDFLRRSIEKLPTAMACNDLGEDLRLQNKLAEAEGFARQALILDPRLLSALDTLACILLDAGKVEEAAKVASKAVAANPGQPIYQLTLLRAQVKQGDKAGVNQRLRGLAESRSEIPVSLQKEIEALR